MPRDDPGSVPPAVVADILAFILSENGFPAGPRDLSGDADALARIRIVEELPMTVTGKIQKFAMREAEQQELAEPEREIIRPLAAASPATVRAT